MISVILCGGSGSRLWPVSRESHPKPFLNLPDGQSLMEKAYLRAEAIPGNKGIITITNKSLLFKAAEAAEKATVRQVSYILEPFGRNTAPAVAFAALDVAKKQGGHCLMLILPADHLISDQVAFTRTVLEAAELAAAGLLVTFGIKPDAPETGYGYIEADGHRALRFVEKPDTATAADYLASGRFLWNSGMFCFMAETFLEQICLHAPEVLTAVKNAAAASQKYGNGWDALNIDPDSFAEVPNISLDYALMEKSDRVAVVSCEVGWSDIGSWTTWSALNQCDYYGNHLNAPQNVILEDTADCCIHSDGRLVAALGLKDVLIVDTPDALLVADKNKSQDVKRIYDRLKQENNEAYKLHRTEHRPWGNYTILETGPRFKIKRLEIKSGASLSLQMHHHRNEHWVVVSGIAEVTCDDNVFWVDTNESTYIKAGHKHRVTNRGLLPLVIIEVQSGEYLGENDIIRFEDHYGR